MWNLEDLPLLPIKSVRREESIAIELNETINGIDMYNLMKNAGKAIGNHVKTLKVKNILVLAGSGNNGGDGIVACSELVAKHKVTLVLISQPKTREATKALDKLTNVNKPNLTVLFLNLELKLEDLIASIETYDVVIDSLLGVGITSTLRSPYSEIIEKFSEIESKICSIDLPSGLDCNTGEWYGNSFKPQSVITMQYKKEGLKSLDKSTKIIVADIGINPKSYYYIDKGHFKTFWPVRDLNSHKGQNGRIIVIGGSDGFTGAPVLSGLASLRAGVDTLRIAVPESIRGIVASYAEDFIVLKVSGDKITSKGFKRFLDLTVNRHDVAVVGMGISNHPEVVKFVLEFYKFAKDKMKIVLDADAIRAFRRNLDLLKNTKTVITPHRAELRMMLDEPIPNKLPKLINFLQIKAKELGIVILLKGRVDIITNGKRTYLNSTGHPGMTVGGTGDVLAGLVGAANSFIDDPTMATAIAAFIMGKAGELAAEKYGNSLLASDVIKEIPKAIMSLEEDDLDAEF